MAAKSKETIAKLKELLKLALEIADPGHRCEKCSLSKECKMAYKKKIESEACNRGIVDNFDDEFFYPLEDNDEEDCLIQREARKFLDGEDKKVVAEK